MMDGLRGSEHALDSILPSFTWDEYIDLLDGESFDLLIGKKLSNPDFHATKRSLLDKFSSSPQYLFDSSRRAAEVFWLKLNLCEAVCRHVADEHEHTCRSYGVLDPAHVQIEVRTNTPTALPLFWNISLTVGHAHDQDLTPFAQIPSEMTKGLQAMPVGADLNYAAPLLKQWSQGRELSATVIVQSADFIPNEDGSSASGLIRAHIVTDEIKARDFSEQDVFRILLPLETGRGLEMKAWARKVDTPECGIVVSGMTDPVTTGTWNSFTQRVGHARSDARIAVYRSFASAFDVYSCGMLLLRALVGSQPRRWARLIDVLPMLLDGLSPLVQGVEPGDHYTIHCRVQERLQEFEDLFQPQGISHDVWWDTLIAAFRACSRVQGFGYGYDKPLTERNAAREFAQDLANVARRARIELIDAGNRDALFARVCDQMLAETRDQH
jgi:hypothetical protein